MYIRIYQNINITNKTYCISPNTVPTDSPNRLFRLRGSSGNTTIKKSNIIYVETNKISKN